MKASSAVQVPAAACIAILAAFPAGAQIYPRILWWYDLDAPSLGSASVGDIDGDGMPEIVFGTYFNDEKIHALNAENGSQLWDYDTGGCNDASSVIWDVDGDGMLEVVAGASSPYRIYCFDGTTGGVEWSTSLGYPNCTDSPPAVGDIDGDGKPEIVLGTFYDWVFALNGENGSILWQVDLGDGHIESDPAILDLDGDGDLDIVVAEWMGLCRVLALEGDDGGILWTSTIPEDYMYHGPGFADIDGDSKPELAIGCYDGHVHCLNGEDGSLYWSFFTSSYAGAPTSLADLNGDGFLEVAWGAGNTVGATSCSGSGIWSFPAGGSVFRGSAIADLDDDDTPDLVFGTGSGILYARRGSLGQPLWDIDLQAHYGNEFDIDHAPVIADFDGDGGLDVFVVGGHAESSQPGNNHGRAYALAAGAGTGPGWPMFRHDERHSGCFYGYQTGTGPGGAAGPGRLFISPNPSCGSICAHFFLDEPSRVRLAVYDLSGRLAGGTDFGLLSEGDHEAVLCSEPARRLPAGQYLVMMDADGRVSSAMAVVLP
ncbi:PQQ-like beta-propeller repeat protein [Candidatus Fermentibacteria bacterium]|nr:PQQ-like beta-propeller repeat protein [Candidatus Fermentibacteria bacterium]